MPLRDEDRTESEDQVGLLERRNSGELDHELDDDNSQRSTLWTVTPFILGRFQ